MGWDYRVLLMERIASEVVMRAVGSVVHVGLACMLGAVAGPYLLAGYAFAQSMPQMQPEQPAPPVEPVTPETPPAATASSQAQPQMVAQQAASLVAMTGSETVDVSLRTAARDINQVLRAAGYRDADAGALQRALSSGAGAVRTLRTTLGLGCLVRVDVSAHDAYGVALRALVECDSGAHTVSVQAPFAEISARLVAAITPLIPPAKLTPVVPPVPQQPPVSDDAALAQALDRIVLTDGTQLRGVVLKVEAGQSLTMRLEGAGERTFAWHEVARIHPRDAVLPGGGEDEEEAGTKKKQPADWESRAGWKFTLDVRGQLYGMYGETKHAFVATFNDGQEMRFTGWSPAGGGGGAVSVQTGAAYLGVPTAGEDFMWTVRGGAGLDVGIGGLAYREDNLTTLWRVRNGVVLQTGSREGGNVAVTGAFTVMVPLFLGFQVGHVPEDDAGVRRGWLLGIDWRPTYAYTNPSDIDSMSWFNFGGLQAHADVVSLHADAERIEPQFRMSVTFLPKVGHHPMVAALGFGAAWY